MRVLVTGGSGFLGQQLIKRFLPFVPTTGRVHILDNVAPPKTPDEADARVTSSIVSITDFSTVRHAVKQLAPNYVFHLASIMSGQGEEDFDLVHAVNLEASQNLLEICRELSHPPRFVFASSIAVFGGQPLVNSESATVPTISYGTTKAICELLVADYTRKGFIDGSSCRLPTVLVRPGPPNPAATGCFSSVPKAVLNGYDFVSPIRPDARHPVISVRSAVGGLVQVARKTAAEVGIRPVNLPAVTTTLAELIKLSQEEFESSIKPMRAGEKSGQRKKVPGNVRFEPDAETARVVEAMPQEVQRNEQQIAQLGLPFDVSARDAIKEYVSEHVLMRGLGEIW